MLACLERKDGTAILLLLCLRKYLVLLQLVQQRPLLLLIAEIFDKFPVDLNLCVGIFIVLALQLEILFIFFYRLYLDG